MDKLNCQHCGQENNLESNVCHGCGMPLSSRQAKIKTKKFLWWFLFLVIFSFFMMFWLPPNWLALLDK